MLVKCRFLISILLIKQIYKIISIIIMPNYLPKLFIIIYSKIFQMEKSMVNQLRNLAHSTVWNQSQITTTSTDNVYDLRKSRINNLPNYKKTDLSGKLNFIVAFQAIQIQRLSVEVQALRSKLLQAERIVFTNGNYQVQIKELTQKCIAMELQREEYKTQLEKMNTICQNLYHQLQGVKNAYTNMEKSLNMKERENDELKRLIESYKLKLAEMDKKIKNSQQITFQYNQLVIKCQNLENQLAAAREKNEQSQEQFKRKKRELKDDFQKQISNFNNENNAIKKNLDRALIEIADWKQKSVEMAERIDKYIDIEKDKQRLQKELKKERQINSEQIAELRKKNNALEEDIINLVKVVDDRSRKIKELKQFLQEIQSKHEEKVTKCLKNIDQLMHSVQTTRKQAEYFQDKLVQAQNQIVRLQNDNQDLQLSLQKIKSEGTFSQDFIQQFMKLKQLSALKDRQIQNMLMRQLNIEQVLMFMRRQLEKQYAFTEQSNKKWAMYQKSIEDLNVFVNKAMQMQSELARLSEENVNLISNNRILNLQIQSVTTTSELSQIQKPDSSFPENISKLTSSKSNYQLQYPRSILTPKNRL